MNEGQRSLSLPSGLDIPACGGLARLLDAAAGGGGPRTDIPFIAPLMLLTAFPGAAALAAAPARKGHVLIQESLSIDCRSPIRPGEALAAEGRIESESLQGAGMVLSLDVRAAAGGEIVRLLARLREVPASGLVALKPLALARATRGAQLASWETPALTQDAVTDYVRLAGDGNPLHTDAAFARSVGLEGTVVPGALLAGLLEPVLPLLGEMRSLRGLRMRFAAPHPVGESAGFAVVRNEASTRDDEARVFIHRADGGVTAIADLAFR
ncbi:MaoC family dehydratase [Zhengella sp. ZM62]|uniref:MaoC family dehydratase n=1 Tax=Zhengella sedimenti TaxID=3390035 RepID=UPI003975EE56